MLGRWFTNSNIFLKIGNKIVIATAIEENNLTKTAAIFENFCRKLARNIADI